MANRFYVQPERILDYTVKFTADQGKQIRNVLRLRTNDNVRVFDGSGREFGVQLEEVGAVVTGSIFETVSPGTEPNRRLTLVQALPKGEKLDWILQKCTEIGVSEFIFVDTARSITKISSEKLPQRIERWKAIVKEAAEQSGRVCLPTIAGVTSFSDALARTSDRGVGFIAWEGETERLLTTELSRVQDETDITCFIGPEGGFTQGEIRAAGNAGITPVSLGPRILRTETAAIVGSGLIIYSHGSQ